jgi:hypothetical protein
MPFDPTPMEVSRSGVEVGKLRRLSEALKGEMPKGFRWAFEEIYVEKTTQPSWFKAVLWGEKPQVEIAGCALGLATFLGIFPNARYLDADKVQEGRYALFGLSRDDSRLVFGVYGYWHHEVYDPAEVMPWMVAAAIDRIIERETAGE